MSRNFNDINITTTTVIIPTNIDFNLDVLYDALHICDETQIITSKTNKDFQRKIISMNPPSGSITMVQFKDKLKGFKIKKKKTKYFRNALSLVMYVNKLITIKIPTKGSFQMTGCINQEQSIECIKHIWRMCLNTKLDNLYTITGDFFECKIRTVMTDIVFKVGFNVNREHLDRYMNSRTDFNSLLETTFGYTGVNIKIPFDIENDDKSIITLNYKGEEWNEGCISYADYLDTLSDKNRLKEIRKKRRNTFLVFHSGTAIMSGMVPHYMENVYNTFINIMKDARNDIEEYILPEA